jgi:hypothetical protein
MRRFSQIIPDEGLGPHWSARGAPGVIVHLTIDRSNASAYLERLYEWVEAARADASVEDLMPVCYRNSTRPVPPTAEYAETLASRIKGIRTDILPWLAGWTPDSD